MKISKLTRTASVIALAALAASACDDGLTDLNENPNSPANVAAPLLFSAGTKGVVDRAFGSTFFWDYSNAWVQHWAKIQYTTEDRYGLRPAANDAHWTGFYSGSTLGDGGLIDLHRVVLKADSLNQPGWKAQGLTMRTFTIGIVTDTWGDVPYSAALQGIEALGSKPEAVQPTYDTQESIYRQMLADLRTANQLLVPGPAVIGSEDLIYNGNAARWRRFANSLRLRYSMRLSDVDAITTIDAAQEFRDGLAAGVFAANADNAMLRYATVEPSNNQVNEVFQTRLDHTISKTMVDTLKALRDPRLPVYAELPAVHAGKDVNDLTLYRGQTNGAASSDAPFAQLSMLGARFLAPDAPAVLMSYAEVLFLRAEAAARGWTTENAAQLYRSAIRANMEYYGIRDTAIDAYLAQPRVQLPAGREAQIAQIQLQKWIALFDNGAESWAEYRRTGYPQLKPGPRATFNSGVLPTRFSYPNVEAAVNAANRDAAAGRQNGANMRTPLWWAQ
jgi:hypothetical protein